MPARLQVLSAGVIVADHVFTPITHLPAEGELVTADGMLLTIGGCAANAAVDLAKMQVNVAVVGRVGGDHRKLFRAPQRPLRMPDRARLPGKRAKPGKVACENLKYL
jgi:hypothetical protein